ncbi:unnamed protein product [Phytophthora lilii]|uniref:Unnamed protein product n=1 Tax=Phytophthora lilii TaxID=2077276 RepID=A0A9W6TNC4_9STRA|nr:unnamed protein product [Phytophthora lilii]
MPLFRKKSRSSSSSASAGGSIDFAELQLGKAVGAGRSGSTFSAHWAGRHVAAKVVDLSAAANGQELLKELRREEQVAGALRHPNIVQFLGAASAPPRYCLVFEFMEGGTLAARLRARGCGPLDFFRLATDMAQGMSYLHEHSVMHRDLKSSNVLLDAEGTAKISDFGLSCVMELGHTADLTAETGTYGWMAPEVIRHEPYSSKADVYSFAVVLWELLAKDIPFKGQTPMQSEWLATPARREKGSFCVVFCCCSGHGRGRAAHAARPASTDAGQNRGAHRALLEPGPDAASGLQLHCQGAALREAVAEQVGLQERRDPLHGVSSGRDAGALTCTYSLSFVPLAMTPRMLLHAPCRGLRASRQTELATALDVGSKHGPGNISHHPTSAFV